MASATGKRSILNCIVEEVNKHVAACMAKDPQINVEHLDDQKMGFAQKLKICCRSCLWKIEPFTSPEIKKDGTPGQTRFSVNSLAVIAFRKIGKGHEASTVFNSFMNMPPPMAKKTYSSSANEILEAYEGVARQSMERAATEIKQDEAAVITDCSVTIDGTWQKCGFASLNGAVVAVSSEGKVIEFQVMSKHCMGCRIWKNREVTPAYDDWRLTHKYHINHKKSAGAMEADGAVAIFTRTTTTHNLRYHWYIGDGDTEAFSKVKSSNPYGDIVPEKLECVGHVQKRLGIRLRTLRSNLTGKLLEDGKKSTGIGRLTDKAINILHNYYGMAIRQNTHSLYSMKKAVGAVLYHCSDISDEEQHHTFCPRESETWFKWEADTIRKTSIYRKLICLFP